MHNVKLNNSEIDPVLTPYVELHLDRETLTVHSHCEMEFCAK